MKECYFCGKKEDENEIFGVINGTELVNSCESCSIRENLPIIRKANYSQLGEGEKSYSVYERLNRMAGTPQKPKEKRDYISKSGITLDKLRKPADYNLKTIRKDELKSNRSPANIVDNLNWVVQTSRRRAKLSQKQLADSINEDEEKIVIIEQGNFPENPEKILHKLEKSLNVSLFKGTSEIKEEKKIKPLPTKVEDWSYSEVEEKPVFIREKINQKQKSSYILKLDRDKIKNLTISDLNRMKNEKESSEKEKIRAVLNENERKEGERFRTNLERKAERDMSMKEIDEMIWRRSKNKKPKTEEEKITDDKEINELVEEVNSLGEEKKKDGFFKIFKEKFKRIKKKKSLTKEEVEKIMEEQSKEEEI
jgi:ribosome-binding protein aMBF1 (putative translation factor)